MVAADSNPALDNSVFFEQLAPEDQQKILAVCANETWQKGRSVASQDVASTIYFIMSGHIKSLRINPETGRSVTLFMFGPGDMFDVLQLLQAPVDETIFEAHTDVALLTVPQGEVSRWMVHYPEFNRAMLPYLGKMIAHLENKAASLALHDTETRLADLIIRHLDANGEPDWHNNIPLINDMNHETLAQMIGSVRSVVNRQLHHWREAGIIATDHGKITVRKLERLLDKAENHLPWK